MPPSRITFITGTDTGVGKTLLTALLLHHLRESGIRALAMKPFCSGGMGDVRLLQALQPGELSDAEMNPFYFKEPIAPYVATRKSGRTTEKEQLLERINHVRSGCEHLLIEGSGGLLVPLGKEFGALELIAELNCRVIIVGRNRLGTINHTLLTINALRTRGILDDQIRVILMNNAVKADVSQATNCAVISELAKPIGIEGICHLGARLQHAKAVKSAYPSALKPLKRLTKWLMA